MATIPGIWRWMRVPRLIWQFTESNVPTFVLPNSSFGILAALAAPRLTDRPDALSVAELLLQALPRVMLFNWANVFVFDLANQRLPEARREDETNKPWRPLPSKLISAEEMRRWMLVAIPAAVAISAVLGVGHQSALILLTTWAYNDLRGGDEIIRDVIIALGYWLYLSSSLLIAVGPGHHLSEHGYRWLGMMSGIILTTMQVQDLKDQPGDRTRGRRTVPLVLGETFSRWWIAGCVLVWSIACPLVWRCRLAGYVLPMGGGLWVGFHVLQGTNDAAAWRWWCLWQGLVYLTPWMAGR
ncbi:hypothetical protein N7532_008807 [Penicillium argentinense]|uniref:Uncharacterized protein n=1 Tax=Penicillium argentinense TaxID=1131581 RepID=A0A9W9EY36_9EURO|nr:uncharacterized protein N7532_008807 [Penicillium argentinense]KAJ5090123.1 hypothetical protein N7532_008807 [Penicillium argentinense]